MQGAAEGRLRGPETVWGSGCGEGSGTGLLTVGHGLDLHGLGDLLVAGPAGAPPAHLGLEERVQQGGLPQPAVTWGQTHRRVGAKTSTKVAFF